MNSNKPVIAPINTQQPHNIQENYAPQYFPPLEDNDLRSRATPKNTVGSSKGLAGIIILRSLVVAALIYLLVRTIEVLNNFPQQTENHGIVFAAVCTALLGNLATIILSAVSYKKYRLLNAVFFSGLVTDVIVVAISIAGWQVVVQNMQIERDVASDSSSVNYQSGESDPLSDSTIAELFKLAVCIVTGAIHGVLLIVLDIITFIWLRGKKKALALQTSTLAI